MHVSFKFCDALCFHGVSKDGDMRSEQVSVFTIEALPDVCHQFLKCDGDHRAPFRWLLVHHLFLDPHKHVRVSQNERQKLFGQAPLVFAVHVDGHAEEDVQARREKV